MKTIIISPTCSGKSIAIEKNEFAYCGEYLSSDINHTKGFKMGGFAPLVPNTHPYYKSWNELYKLGVDEFWNNSKYIDSFLIFNGADIIDWIKKVYFWDCGPNNTIKPQKGICLKMVLIDESTHYQYFLNRMEEAVYNIKLKELLIQSHPITLDKLKNWEFIKTERITYKSLAETYNIPIFKTFDEAFA